MVLVVFQKLSCNGIFTVNCISLALTFRHQDQAGNAVLEFLNKLWGLGAE
jgi:hypothetical protein